MVSEKKTLLLSFKFFFFFLNVPFGDLSATSHTRHLVPFYIRENTDSSPADFSKTWQLMNKWHSSGEEEHVSLGTVSLLIRRQVSFHVDRCGTSLTSYNTQNRLLSPFSSSTIDFPAVVFLIVLINHSGASIGFVPLESEPVVFRLFLHVCVTFVHLNLAVLTCRGHKSIKYHL